MRCQSIPSTAVTRNQYFEARLTPTGDGRGFQSFKLEIENKTQSNLELDWSRTLFIADNQTRGGFMSEGILYNAKDSPRLVAMDVIFTDTTFSRTIWPSTLAYFVSGRYGGWRHGYMGRVSGGEYGVLLSVKTNGEEHQKKLTVRIVQEGSPQVKEEIPVVIP